MVRDARLELARTRRPTDFKSVAATITPIPHILKPVKRGKNWLPQYLVRLRAFLFPFL